MKFATYLPLHYNDGSEVPDEEIQAILTELYQKFGGATVSGPVSGHWVDQGTVYNDQSLVVEIATERERLPEVQAIILEIGRRLQQEAMFLEVKYYDGVQILRM